MIYIGRLYRRVRSSLLGRYFDEQNQKLDGLRAMLGAQQARQVRSDPTGSIDNHEFQVFSQFGEDGIIQSLISRVPIENETFVEIGVGDYAESNTRFLLVHNNWRGAIFNLGTEHLDFITRTGLRWRYTIDAFSAFVTRDNVNRLIVDAGMGGDIGLLSLDIDGNDYWVFKELTAASPRIIILEYNNIFGSEHAVTIPYRERFDRAAAHPSYLYFGASLAALTEAAREKGYRLVAGNSNGHNAFFVRNDLAPEVPEKSPKDVYVRSRFREARDPEGRLSYVDSHAVASQMLGDLPLVDVRTQEEIRFKDLGLKGDDRG